MLGKMEQQSEAHDVEWRRQPEQPQATVDDLRLATFATYQAVQLEKAATPEFPTADLFALNTEIDSLRVAAIEEDAA